jgi:hypothetical protein
MFHKTDTTVKGSYSVIAPGTTCTENDWQTSTVLNNDQIEIVIFCSYFLSFSFNGTLLSGVSEIPTYLAGEVLPSAAVVRKFRTTED